MDREGHAEVTFTDVRVPREALLAGEGDGFMISQARLGPGRIHHCMRAIGVAERALDLMIDRAQSRVTFGEPVANRANVMDWVAESRIEIEMARLLTLKAAHMMDTVGNKVARTEIAAIKVAAPNVALKVLDVAADESAVREYTVLAETAVEHVVRVHDCLRTEGDGRTVLVLDWMAGGSLGDVIRARGFLSAGEVVTVLSPLATALGRLHRLGVPREQYRAQAHLAQLVQGGGGVLLGFVAQQQQSDAHPVHRGDDADAPLALSGGQRLPVGGGHLDALGGEPGRLAHGHPVLLVVLGQAHQTGDPAAGRTGELPHRGQLLPGALAGAGGTMRPLASRGMSSSS